MRIFLILLPPLLAISPALPVTADTMFVPVDPGAVMAPPASGDIDLPFTGLNGMALDGQALTVDLIFADDLLARVWLQTELAVLLIVQTDAGTFPGFATDASGWLIAPDGTPMLGPKDAGSAMSSSGAFAVGLGEIFPAMINQVADFAGVHFDLTVPDTGFHVTGGTVRWSVPEPSKLQIGTAAQLPEPATALLLGLGLVGVGWAAYRRQQSGQRGIRTGVRRS
jgi:hypothetical protein